MTCGSSDFWVIHSFHFGKFPFLENFCFRVTVHGQRGRGATLTLADRKSTRAPAAFPAEIGDGTGWVRTPSSSSFRPCALLRPPWTVRVPARANREDELRPRQLRPRLSSGVPEEVAGEVQGSCGGGFEPRRARWWLVRRAPVESLGFRRRVGRFRPRLAEGLRPKARAEHGGAKARNGSLCRALKRPTREG